MMQNITIVEGGSLEYNDKIAYDNKQCPIG